MSKESLFCPYCGSTDLSEPKVKFTGFNGAICKNCLKEFDFPLSTVNLIVAWFFAIILGFLSLSSILVGTVSIMVVVMLVLAGNSAWAIYHNAHIKKLFKENNRASN